MDSTPVARKYSYRNERNFGIVVGGVFAGLGSWWVYAGKFPAVAPGILTLGGLLILFGLLFPKALVYPNRAWMGLAEILGFIMTRVILAIVFYLLVTPIGFIKRLWGWDPLRLRADPSQSYWKSYAARQRDPRHYEKMY